jgi:hypothetical protein
MSSTMTTVVATIAVWTTLNFTGAVIQRLTQRHRQQKFLDLLEHLAEQEELAFDEQLQSFVCDNPECDCAEQ